MPRIKHIVLMKFKPEITQETIDGIVADFHHIKAQLPGMLDFSIGPNVSKEGVNKGFTHGFVMTFENAEALQTYLPHPDHVTVKKKILESLDGGLDGAMIIDWEEPD